MRQFLNPKNAFEKEQCFSKGIKAVKKGLKMIYVAPIYIIGIILVFNCLLYYNIKQERRITEKNYQMRRTNMSDTIKKHDPIS